MSEIADIADGVKERIKSSGALTRFRYSYFVGRVYVPFESLQELSPSIVGFGKPEDVKILVTPFNDQFTLIARGVNQEAITIRVYVLKKLPAESDGTLPTDANAFPEENTLLDDMSAMSRAIARCLLPGVTICDATLTECKFSAIFDAAAMVEERLFVSQITLTFKQAV